MGGHNCARRLLRCEPILKEMIAQGVIPGDPSRFFRRSVLPWKQTGDGLQTSLSDAEQERLAHAIKKDLVAFHHGRLQLTHASIQALRLLIVAHRQGLNPTPLLEIRRDALTPGLLPGTVHIQTRKFRAKTIHTGIGRAVPPMNRGTTDGGQYLSFSLAEAAILGQAIADTEPLIAEAPANLKDRVWLYRSNGFANFQKVSAISCLNQATLALAVSALIKRQELVGDDGERLSVNLSRLRKSFFERAFRAASGDLVW